MKLQLLWSRCVIPSCLVKKILKTCNKVFVGQITIFILLYISSIQYSFAQNKCDGKIKFLLSTKNNFEKNEGIRSEMRVRADDVNISSKINEDMYECIVYTKNPDEVLATGAFVNSIYPDFITVNATIDVIEKIVNLKSVKRVEAPTKETLHNDIAIANSGADLLHRGILNNTKYTGRGVLVGIYDTGIDWKHLDFRDSADHSKSRIYRIWDQSLLASAGETPPTGFYYGVEYTREQISEELDSSPAGFVRTKDISGHGTHVAGTAAGNGMSVPIKKFKGFAPDAELVIVKGGNVFFSSSKIIDGLTYFQTVATAAGKPIVVNMSLGGQVGAHDGKRDYEIAVDNFNSKPGRSVVISAGNDNGKQIHNSLDLPPYGSGEISFTLPSISSANDIMRYRFYLNDTSSVSTTLIIPSTVSGGADETICNIGETIRDTISSANFIIYLENDIEIISGKRYVDLYIDNLLATSNPTGVWKLVVNNNSSNALKLHGWVYNYNSIYKTLVLDKSDNSYMVASPGNAATAITVGSSVSRIRHYSSQNLATSTYFNSVIDNISKFSNTGPRVDGLMKPEITCDGQGIISCLSSASTPDGADVVVNGLYKKSEGTSMSAPGVTGAIALLFQANPNLNCGDIKSLITSTASSDNVTGLTPNPIWGYGRLDIFKAASRLSNTNCIVGEKRIYKYDTDYSLGDVGATVDNDNRYAVKFTPDMNGKLGGIYLSISSSITDLKMEIRKSNSVGLPGDSLGSKIIENINNNILLSTYNYIDFSDMNIHMDSSKDYFIIFYRNNPSKWSFRYQGGGGDGRSFDSKDFGASWYGLSYDIAVRALLHNDKYIASGDIATKNAKVRADLSESYEIFENCQAIAKIVPKGVFPVSGIVDLSVWNEPEPQVSSGGFAYIQRHYQITPAINPDNATGMVTLYFSQAEFTNYNNNISSPFKLPFNSEDIENNKINLKLIKYSGTSSNGSGLLDTYLGASTIIDPADSNVVWNQTYKRWEVSVEVEGFSGFFAFAEPPLVALPINLIYFNASSNDKTNKIVWKVSCFDNAPIFEIERSIDGKYFKTIGRKNSTIGECRNEISFEDIAPLSSTNYYRLKIIQDDGNVKYSHIISVAYNSKFAIYPTILNRFEKLNVQYNEEDDGRIKIIDMRGNTIFTSKLSLGLNSVSLKHLSAAGLYFYLAENNRGTIIANGKIIIK